MKESETFVYMAAHDLRAPLMSVKGLLNLMKIDPERENLDKYCTLLESSVEKMNQSINDIITYSKSGKQKISLQDVDLKQVANDAIQSLSFMRSDFIKITVDTQDVKFISDYNFLFSIFNNLISNAIRYSDPEKDSFLKISAISNSEDVEIVFEDNGIGIDESIHERIFDRYFLDSKEHCGSGLGLYMVKCSLEKLDGDIHVQSKVGEGSIFTVQIPKLIRKEI